MDYNTSRKRLPLPEYGRNIQMMVDMIIDIPDREEKNRAAHAIIEIMGSMNPHLRDISDFNHKLWDHLAIMADFKLDIDFPYDTPSPDILTTKPLTIPYDKTEMKFRHLGKISEVMLRHVMQMPDGDDRRRYLEQIAAHMKRSYNNLNKDGTTDDAIAEMMSEIAQQRIDVQWIKQKQNNNPGNNPNNNQQKQNNPNNNQQKQNNYNNNNQQKQNNQNNNQQKQNSYNNNNQQKQNNLQQNPNSQNNNQQNNNQLLQRNRKRNKNK